MDEEDAGRRKQQTGQGEGRELTLEALTAALAK